MMGILNWLSEEASSAKVDTMMKKVYYTEYMLLLAFLALELEK